MRITDVIETHNHADHVSGRPQLMARGGATARIHQLAGAEYPHVPFSDGDVIEVGAVRLSILHTPGHRPEHCAVTVVDPAHGAEPVAVLTGDSLFVGDVARPDLAIEPREGAGELYESLERLAALPDAVEVLPAHIGGSLCGSARMSTDTRSTIGAQRRQNSMFTETDKRTFIDELTSDLAPQPPNFRRIVARNRARWEADTDPPARVDAPAARELQKSGATIIDGRGIDAVRRRAHPRIGGRARAKDRFRDEGGVDRRPGAGRRFGGHRRLPGRPDGGRVACGRRRSVNGARRWC